MAQSMGAVPAAVINATQRRPRSADAVVGSGNVQIKGYQVKLEGDVARGQFVANMAGKDVYVTAGGTSWIARRICDLRSDGIQDRRIHHSRFSCQFIPAEKTCGATRATQIT